MRTPSGGIDLRAGPRLLASALLVAGVLLCIAVLPGSGGFLLAEGPRASVHAVAFRSSGPLQPRGSLAPSAPADLSVLAANGSVNASWRASVSPDGAAILYTLSWSNYLGGPPAVAVTTSATNLAEPDLENGLTYYFTVNATTVDGSSASSPAVAATPAAVPYPPTILELNAASSSSMQVAWSPPDLSGGSPVTAYLLRYTANGSSNWSYLPAGLDLSVELVGLTPMTHYRVDVLAENSVGSSYPSATLAATTFAGPANPAHVPPAPTLSPPFNRTSPMTTVTSLLGIALVAVLAGPFIWIILRWRGPRAPPEPISRGPQETPSTGPNLVRRRD